MHIELDRIFRELLLKEHMADTEQLQPGPATFTLPVLLDELRVVVLSEGGSGKTQEIREAARRLRRDGKEAFFLRLEHVGQDFDSAFEVGSLEQFQAWLVSPNPGWVLLDSIDESRLRSPLDFAAAMRVVGKRLSTAKPRTHLLLTGRAAAWRPQTDLELCDSLFHIEAGRVAGSEGDIGTQDAVIVNSAGSQFKIVTLQELSRDQIKTFASAKGIADTERFLDDIERADAWSFTARPQDLLELTEYWLDKGGIGSRLELMKNSVKRRLKEPSQSRAEAQPLPNDKALEGVQLIAAALMLTGIQNIRVPDGINGARGLDAGDLLNDWPAPLLGTLLQRPLFDQDIYGTVRFHHRSVKEYLAAKWFLKLLGHETSRRRVEELFVREQYGLEVVVPSLRPLLPWLAVEDSRILARVRQIAPEVLFEGGDPVCLPVGVRSDTLEQVCAQIASGASSMSMADFSAIQRFAAHDLTDALRQLVKAHEANEEIVYFLMRMVWQGRLGGALPEALRVAKSPHAQDGARVAAFRAVAEVGGAAEMASIRSSFLGEPDELSRRCMADLVSHVEHPDSETLHWLLSCIPRLAKQKEFSPTGLSEQIASFFDRAEAVLVAGAIDRLHALLVEPPVFERRHFEVSLRYRWLCKPAGAAVRRLAALRDPAALRSNALAVLYLLPLDAQYNHHAYDLEKLGLAKLVQQWPALHWALFWHVVEQERENKAETDGRVTEAWMALSVARYVSFEAHDFDAAVDAIHSRPLPDDKMVALTLAFRLYALAGHKPEHASCLRKAAGADTQLAARLELLLNPPEKDAAATRIDKENARWNRQAKARTARIEKARRDAPAHLDALVEHLRDPGFEDPIAVSQAQGYMLDRMRELEENKGSRWSNGHWRGLEREFGTRSPRAFRDGIVRYWRRHAPKLVSEGAEIGKMSLADLFGLTGLTIEATEDPRLCVSLSADEAAVAFRYAVRELNGFPQWLPALFNAHPAIVKSMTLAEVGHELQMDQADTASQYFIYNLCRVGDWLWDSVAPELLRLLRTKPPKTLVRLEQLVEIVVASKLPDATVAALAAEKLVGDAEPKSVALWAATWTSVDPDAAIDAVEAHLSALPEPGSRTEFAMTYVTYLLGGRHAASRVRPGYRTPAVLARLYMLVHGHVRASEDIDRCGKGVYSPGPRDHAQDARERLVGILKEIPGRDAFLALRSISERHPEEKARPWFTLQARSKAETDSERPAWSVEQVRQFNDEYERTPANHRELFDLAVLRLLDLQHELEHGNESVAPVVIRADQETLLRNWIASWCRDRSRGRYVIPQEQELPDAKRPDLWWTSSRFSGPVPVELKIADKWSGPSLFERLENQLAGDYLRDDSSCRGVYLLVQRGTQKRWQLRNGAWVNFSELIEALQRHWILVANAHPRVEEIKVIGIDLTKRAGGLAKKTPMKKAAKTSKQGVAAATERLGHTDASDAVVHRGRIQ